MPVGGEHIREQIRALLKAIRGGFAEIEELLSSIPLSPNAAVGERASRYYVKSRTTRDLKIMASDVLLQRLRRQASSFDLFIDLPANSVSRRGKRCNLSPNAIDVLVFLILRFPEIVTPEEILEGVFRKSGRHLSISSVYRAISTLYSQLQGGKKEGPFLRKEKPSASVSSQGFGYLFLGRAVNYCLIGVSSSGSNAVTENSG